MKDKTKLEDLKQATKATKISVQYRCPQKGMAVYF